MNDPLRQVLSPGAALSRRRLLQTSAALTALASSVRLGDVAAQEPLEEVIIAIGADTRVLDPDLDQGLNEMYTLIFNTPVGINNDGLPEPQLAEKWEYTDDLTLSMALRQDAVWQDGTPLTADDFVYTWQRMNDPARESTNVQAFTPWLKDVVAVDDHTVEFQTIEPFAPALDELTGFWLAPRHYIEEVGDEAFGLKPLGSGPYKVAEWQKDQFLALEAADTWWVSPRSPSRKCVS